MLLPVHLRSRMWSLLFWATPDVTFRAGFDARSTSNTSAISSNMGRCHCRAEGWKLYQPPLYYLHRRRSLQHAVFFLADRRRSTLLCSLGLLFGIVQFVLVFFSLRFLFLHQPRSSVFYWQFADELPADHATNEMQPAPALATTTLYLCLRLALARMQAYPRWHRIRLAAIKRGRLRQHRCAKRQSEPGELRHTRRVAFQQTQTQI